MRTKSEQEMVRVIRLLFSIGRDAAGSYRCEVKLTELSRYIKEVLDREIKII